MYTTGQFVITLHSIGRLVCVNQKRISTCNNFESGFTSHTLKRISKWPPSYFHILGKVFGEKYK